MAASTVREIGIDYMKNLWIKSKVSIFCNIQLFTIILESRPLYRKQGSRTDIPRNDAPDSEC